MDRKERKKQLIQATLLQFPERSDRQLARELHCSRVFLAQLREKLGIASYDRNQDITRSATKRPAIQTLIDAHPEWSDAQVASAVGCHYSYVSLIRRGKR